MNIAMKFVRKRLFIKKTGLRFFCLASLLVLVLGQFSITVNALSPDQKKVMQEGIYYYNVDTCGLSTSANTSTTGETTGPPKAVQKVVWDTLVSGGIDPMHAAAVMGNIAHEGLWDPENSSENPNAPPRSKDPTVTGDGYGYGLIGWTPGQSLLDQMKEIGIANDPPYTAETQAAVILAEIQGKTQTYDSSVGKQFLNTKTIEDATSFYEGGSGFGFERPADPAATQADRIASAKQFLQEFGGSTPTASPSSSSGTTSSGSCCPPGGSATAGSPVSASDNEATVWNYLVSQMGLSATQAAGIMGNMQQESGFDPTSENSGTHAYGIAQWYAGRETALESFASKQGKSKSDINVQLDYLRSELEGSYKSSVLDPLKKSNSLEEAVRIWLIYYEAPCLASDTACVNSEMSNRMPFAKAVLQKYGNGAVAAGAPDSCSGSDSTAAANGWNLPPDQNAMVYYGQCDPKWANHPYGTGKSSVCVGGCGITSMSMVVATLADKNQTPITMADKYGNTYHTSGGTSWALWPAAAHDFNLKEKDIGLDFNQAAATVKAGGLVIIAVNPGKFTSEGHVMVIRAVTDNGDFLLADPNNAGSKQLGRGDTNNTPYSADTLKGPGAAMNMWAFTK